MTPFRFVPAAFVGGATLALGLGLAAAGGVWAQPTRLPLPPVGDTAPTTGGGSTPITGDRVAPRTVDSIVGGDLSLKQREDRLGALLDSSLADHSLGHTEYGRAGAELADIKATEDRLRQRNHGELTDTETFRLEGRIKTLAQSIRWAR